MAADLSRTAVAGVEVQACGDCHLASFGGFAAPERRIIFDINDFDETSTGPWEWDVTRLAASFVSGLSTNALFSAENGRECAWPAARSDRKWTGAGEHRRFYIRQLKGVKLEPQVELATPPNAKVYARYSGRALARADCRSGDPVVLSAYMGDSEAFEDAMADSPSPRPIRPIAITRHWLLPCERVVWRRRWGCSSRRSVGRRGIVGRGWSQLGEPEPTHSSRSHPGRRCSTLSWRTSIRCIGHSG
jgi:hypothetical protein